MVLTCPLVGSELPNADIRAKPFNLFYDCFYTLKCTATVILIKPPIVHILLSSFNSVNSLLFIKNVFLLYIGLDIYIEEDHYTFLEGQTQNPMIRLQFGRTQNPFKMTLFPVSIREAIDPNGFNMSAFITSQAFADATPGK